MPSAQVTDTTPFPISPIYTYSYPLTPYKAYSLYLYISCSSCSLIRENKEIQGFLRNTREEQPRNRNTSKRNTGAGKRGGEFPAQGFAAVLPFLLFYPVVPLCACSVFIVLSCCSVVACAQIQPLNLCPFRTPFQAWTNSVYYGNMLSELGGSTSRISEGRRTH